MAISSTANVIYDSNWNYKWGKARISLSAYESDRTESSIIISYSGVLQTYDYTGIPGHNLTVNGVTSSTHGANRGTPYNEWKSTGISVSGTTTVAREKTNTTKTISASASANSGWMWIYDVGLKQDFWGCGYFDTISTSVDVSVPALSKYTVKYSVGTSTIADTPTSNTDFYGSTITLPDAVSHQNTYDTKYTVIFDANGGTSLSSKNSFLEYTNTFDSWDGNEASSAYTISGNVTLVAKFTKSSGVRQAITTYTGKDTKRSGFTLLGWATSKEKADERIIEYELGEEFEPSSDMTLYAVWRANLRDEGYTLFKDSSIYGHTWEDLIKNQDAEGHPLYDAGGQYKGYSIDDEGYILLFEKRLLIELSSNKYKDVLASDIVERGKDYYFQV